MIHAALWILAAFIVIPTVLLFGGGLLYLLFADGRWIYTLGVIAVIIIWFYNMEGNQRKASEARRMQNTPLQQECISQAKSKASQLAQQAVNGHYDTQSYRFQLNSAYQAAESNCKIKYPAY